MSSTEEKLAKIFPQQFQIRRLMKQIEDLKELREKGAFDIRMILVKSQCITFKVQIGASAFKATKLIQTLRVAQDYKIVVRNNYPAYPPRLFFTHNNMTRFNLRPFQDYMPQVLTLIGQWSAKTTIQQLIKSIPIFLQQMHMQKPTLYKYPSIQEYFELDNMYSWKFCQLFPIRLIRKTGNKQGYMFIDGTGSANGNSEILFLEDVGLEASFMSCDYVKGGEIISLRKKKNTGNQFLLQVKLGYKGISGKYGIQFSSQDGQNILLAIMQCAKVQKQQQQKQQKQQSSQCSQESDSEKKENRESERGLKISEIIEQIVIYESLVDNKMTSQNLSQLVTLLQKVIISSYLASDHRYNQYLTKLQSILANQMAQALLESSNIKSTTPTVSDSATTYDSIVDLI